MLKGAISIDLDTLNTHLKGKGLKKGGYDFLEFKEGIENFLKLLEEFGIKATFFIVGRDLLYPQNVGVVKTIVEKGHEVASHSMNHIQGFRLLGKEEKEREIAEAEEIIFEKTGKKPVGFRAPGWNIDDEALGILKSRKYLYDSSIFPSYLNPVLKLMHFTSMRKRPSPDRTTLGKIKYIFSPSLPHFPFKEDNFIELPISVTPLARLPFFATLLLKTGFGIFNVSYKMIKLWKKPIIYEFHLFDFVDFEKPEFKDQIPSKTEKGVYVPQSIHVPFREKWETFRKALEIMSKDYQFETLENLAKNFVMKK